MTGLREIPRPIHGIHDGFSTYPVLSMAKDWWKNYATEPSRKERLNLVTNRLIEAWRKFYNQADPNITSIDDLWWNVNGATTKFKDWLAQDLRFDAYITGGAIAFFYNSRRLNQRLKTLSDIDIYFQSKRSGELLSEHFESNPSYAEWTPKELHYPPKTALQLIKARSYYATPTGENKIQIMVNPDWCNDPWKVISGFDFWHTFAYWMPRQPDGKSLNMHPYALAAMDNQVLLPAKNRIQKYRLKKMIDNGWIYNEKNFEGVEIVD